MTKRFRPLHELPLFASEEDIAAALMGPGRYSEWRAMAPLLERRGFPAIDGLMGGRYTPAVQKFFDREYRIDHPYLAAARDGPEDWSGSWRSTKNTPDGRAALGTYMGKRAEQKMKRLQKLIEQGAYGERPGRIAYALNASRLPEPTKGLDWRPVSGFNAEDALRDDPGLKPIFEKAMKQGYALVTREK